MTAERGVVSHPARKGLEENPIRGIDECHEWISAMLLRKENPGVIAIPQLSHAWISGQMARAWGNERFAAPAPREIVCFAAELHDIGWLERDQSPVFHEDTGLPQEFLQVPAAVHTTLWRNGVTHARTFGRFVALGGDCAGPWLPLLPSHEGRCLESA
jgi:hypothetical protein